MNAHGNTVLVTGGGSGIGLAIANAFSDLGNRVLISGRNPEKLAEAKQANPEFHTFLCDITQPDQVGMMFGAIAAQHGSLNVLVNNAGIAIPSAFVFDGEAMPKAQREIEANLLGTLRITKGALPLLLSNGDAAIITISSAVAIVPLPLSAIYSATKAGSTRFRYPSGTNFGERASGCLRPCRRPSIRTSAGTSAAEGSLHVMLPRQWSPCSATRLKFAWGPQKRFMPRTESPLDWPSTCSAGRPRRPSTPAAYRRPTGLNGPSRGQPQDHLEVKRADQQRKESWRWDQRTRSES